MSPRSPVSLVRIAFSSTVSIAMSHGHIHVRRDKSVCKFWLDPVSLASNNGFKPRELNRIRQMILDNLARIREAWDEHCGQ